MSFRLKVQRIEQTCLFELEWGTGQRLACSLAYPQYLTGGLTGLYPEWERAYLSFYKSSLRGRVEDSGSVAPAPVDWRSRLVNAETQLLGEFHHWLRSAELFEIRQTIASDRTADTVDLFLTCYSPDLERLPWETWNIAEEFLSPHPIRITRTPVSIRQSTGAKRAGKPRILIVLGDDTGLNFQGDLEAIKPLLKLAEVQFVGWQPGKEIKHLTQEICAAIADEQGWDALFFAGHSNESIAGGELAIAPHTSIALNEIKPQLLQAKERGLQFALFNSCSGLSLAKALIDLGLSQVAVMREPIHNQVAQSFLHKFLNELAAHHNVRDCLFAACQWLKTEETLHYPSTHLVPSLFRHPASDLYEIPAKSRAKDWFKTLLPKPLEAIALTAITFLSLSIPVQDWLIERRVLTQAIYRDKTQQFGTPSPPPVLLVSIDEESIRKAGLIRPNPMDRQYLAQLIQQLTARDARIVGVDYLLDRPHKEADPILGQAIQAAVQKRPHPTTFVFASLEDPIAGWLNVSPGLARPNWSLNGNIHFAMWNLKILSPQRSEVEPLPFGYLLALVSRFNSQAEFQPQPNSQTDFFDRIEQTLRSQQQDYRTVFSWRAQRQPLGNFALKLRQMWLYPILDFSIPPSQAYEQIPAWQLLEMGENAPELPHLTQQAVILAPGGYTEAGVSANQADTFPLPLAVGYWFQQLDLPQVPKRITGGEVHAYAIHHYLRQRIVIPIPDLWGVAAAFLLGKAILMVVKTLKFRNRRKNAIALGLFLIVTPGVYGLVSLQIYIWAAFLLPWLLPSLTLAVSIAPSLRKM